MDVRELLDRARSQIGRNIRYQRGGGVNKANVHTCADARNGSDCSSFVCWSLGINKVGKYPWLLAPGEKAEAEGQWYSTDGIVNDVLHLNVGIFDRTETPRVGGVVVYPTRWKNGKASPSGHCGIITSLKADGTIAGVIHCSSGNYKRTGDAIQETDGSVFERDNTIYAWCLRIDVPAAPGATMRTWLRPVRFIVVASGSRGNAIAGTANEFAAVNPIGRRVVVSSDDEYPDADTIDRWVGDAEDVGAVVLRPDGTLHVVLTIDEASAGGVIEEVFAEAALA